MYAKWRHFDLQPSETGKFERINQYTQRKLSNNGSDYAPRHIPPVQLADIRSRPTQYLPPLEGEGLVHERRRWCLQSGPQLDQLDQAFHRPSTTLTKKEKETTTMFVII